MNNINRETLIDLYIDRGMNRAQVAKELGVGPTTVFKWFAKFNIPRKDPIEVIREVHLGKPKSEEQRKKQSESVTGDKNARWGKKCTSHGKRCWYTLPSGRVVSMRSQWEVWYAQHLESKGVQYDYEPKTFVLSNGSGYTPDFYLIETDEYVEVKGWMRPEHRAKLELFKDDYPNINHTLADQNYLESLGIDLQKKWLSEKPVFQCGVCGKDFHRAYPSQFLCSVSCRNTYSGGRPKKSYTPRKKSYSARGIQRGEQNNHSKLTRDQVDKILELRSEGLTYQRISEITGATPGNISNIVLGKSWFRDDT